MLDTPKEHDGRWNEVDGATKPRAGEVVATSATEAIEVLNFILEESDGSVRWGLRLQFATKKYEDTNSTTTAL